MSEGGNVLEIIYYIMDELQGKRDSKQQLDAYLKENPDDRLKIDNYLNQFHVAFTPGRGAHMLETWKASYPEQYQQFSTIYGNECRSVRDWISGKIENPERKNIIRFCIQSGFADGEIKAVNDLLYAFNYDGLHIRSPEDAVCYFALKNKLPWEMTEQAIKELNWNSKSLSERNKLSGKKTKDIKYTGDVQKSIDELSSLNELVEHIQTHPDDFGPSKITARNIVKKIFAPKDEKQEQASQESEYDKLDFDPADLDPDTWKHTSSERNRNIAKWFCQSARIYNKNEDKKSPEKKRRKSELFNINAILRRSVPISRGEFIIIMLSLPLDQDWPESIAPEASKKRILYIINDNLERCGYDQIDPERGIFDRIILDCIDAATQMKYPNEPDKFGQILNSLFEYLQKSD